MARSAVSPPGTLAAGPHAVCLWSRGKPKAEAVPGAAAGGPADRGFLAWTMSSRAEGEAAGALRGPPAASTTSPAPDASCASCASWPGRPACAHLEGHAGVLPPARRISRCHVRQGQAIGSQALGRALLEQARRSGRPEQRARYERAQEHIDRRGRGGRGGMNDRVPARGRRRACGRPSPSSCAASGRGPAAHVHLSHKRPGQLPGPSSSAGASWLLTAPDGGSGRAQGGISGGRLPCGRRRAPCHSPRRDGSVTEQWEPRKDVQGSSEGGMKSMAGG